MYTVVTSAVLPSLKKREVANPGEKGTGPPRRSPEGKDLPKAREAFPSDGCDPDGRVWVVNCFPERWFITSVNRDIFLRQEVELRINGFYVDVTMFLQCFF